MSDLKSFSFFESYFSALKKLPPKKIGEVVIAMGEYFFEDKEIPECDGITGVALELIRPNLYISKAKALAGKKGGESKPEAKRKQNVSKTEADLKQNESKVQANDKQTASDKGEGKGIRIKEKDKGEGEGKEKDKKEKEGGEKKASRFAPPTLDEIRAYCDERNSPVDPVEFYDFFSEGNWVDSRGNKVKNWKQKLITWEQFKKRDGGGGHNSQANIRPFNPVNYLLEQIEEGVADE